MDILVLDIIHKSDCAVHSEPAFPKGKCNCDPFGIRKQIPEIVGKRYDADPYESAVSACNWLADVYEGFIFSQIQKVYRTMK